MGSPHPLTKLIPYCAQCAPRAGIRHLKSEHCYRQYENIPHAAFYAARTHMHIHHTGENPMDMEILTRAPEQNAGVPAEPVRRHSLRRAG